MKLISSTRVDGDAQFSPDGKKIAFTSNRSGNDEIWVCDSDGSNAQQLTSLGTGNCGGPRWSPDGERIAFSQTWMDSGRSTSSALTEASQNASPAVQPTNPSPVGREMGSGFISTPIAVARPRSGKCRRKEARRYR